MWWTNSLCAPADEDLGTLAEYDPLTGYEPNEYHISETFEPYIQESSGEKTSLNLHDLEIDDNTIGMVPSSSLFTQEREGPASRGQAYHSLEESLLSSQSLSVGHVRTVRLVFDEFGSLISNARENLCRDSVNEQVRRRTTSTRSTTYSLREAHVKSLNEMEELEKFQSSTIDNCKKQIGRRSGYYPSTHRQDSGNFRMKFIV